VTSFSDLTELKNKVIMVTMMRYDMLYVNLHYNFITL
jgi:hypothetical protein